MHHICYHANCADGFMSYVILRHALETAGFASSEIAAYPCQYGKPLPKMVVNKGDVVSFVDFTPEANQGGADTLLEIAKVATLQIWDHHSTAFWAPATQDTPARPGPLLDAAASLRLLGENHHEIHYSPAAGDVKLHTSIANDHFFVLSHDALSGATMLWEHLAHFSQIDAPPAVRRIAYRDLGYAWTEAERAPRYCDDTLSFHAGLMRATLRTYDAWLPLLNTGSDAAYQSVLLRGCRLRDQDEKIIAALVDHHLSVTINGHNIPCVEAIGAGWISDACNALLKAYPSAPFAAARYVCPDSGHMIYSLRSRPGGTDVGAIAKQFGGGGHAQAAGFSTTQEL